MNSLRLFEEGIEIVGYRRFKGESFAGVRMVKD